MNDTQQDKRYGAIALVGATNAGKSTLLNSLAGEKIAITSRKVQTTRFQIRAIVTHKQAQIVFVDTPGFFKPRRQFDRTMLAAAWQSLEDVDIAALLIDASKPLDINKQKNYIDKIINHKKENERILILNKVDQANKANLLKTAEKLNTICQFSQIFMVSALTGDGIQDILDWCAKNIPQGDWVFDDDEITTMPSKLMAAEITREKIYDRLHQELPYHIAIDTESYGSSADGKGLAIKQVVIVEDKHHKSIVLGRSGQMIKAIGTAAREELQNIFECPVHLELFVQHRANWMESADAHREINMMN
jgi:GTP-binding protein Era